MSSGSERARNNVRAGIFVSVGIMLTFLVIIALSDVHSLFSSRTPYQIRFLLSSGVDGLAPGSAVRVGGLEQGKVRGIEPEIVDGRVAAMLVTIELSSQIALYPNARVDRNSSLIGNASSINIGDVGSPSGGARVLAGGTIDASAGAGGALGKFLGDDAAARVGSVLKNVDEMLVDVRADYRESIQPALRRLDEALSNADAVIKSVRADYPIWSGHVTSTLQRADSASAKLEPAFEEARTMIAELRVAIDDARKGIASARGVVDENRQAIDEIVENVRIVSGDAKAITTRVRDDLLARVDAILERGRVGIDSFTDLATRVRAEFDLQMPKLDLILGDARLTAQQLKLASIEVRRSPWRLLYRPSTTELEHELLYESARSFALAAGELESTSRSLDGILSRHADALRTDPALAERLRTTLESSLKRYEEAQAALFTIILEDGAGK